MHPDGKEAAVVAVGSYRRPRVYINGVEVEGVEGVEVSVERVDTTTFGGEESSVPGETTVEISTRYADEHETARDLVGRGLAPHARVGSTSYYRPNEPDEDDDRHEFFQNEEDLPAKLCFYCGMWPEHHNHGSHGCVCSDCLPTAEHLPEGDPVPNSSEARMSFAEGRRHNLAVIDEAVDIGAHVTEDDLARLRARRRLAEELESTAFQLNAFFYPEPR